MTIFLILLLGMAELAEPTIDKVDEEEADEKGHKSPLKKPCHKNVFLVYSAMMASVMMFLAGATISFSSFLLLDVSKLPNPQLRFSTRLQGLFAVSTIII